MRERDAQPEAGGAVAHLTPSRGVQGFPGSQENPSFSPAWKSRETPGFHSTSRATAAQFHTQESRRRRLRICYRGNKVGEMNLVGGIYIYLTVYNHGPGRGKPKRKSIRGGRSKLSFQNIEHKWRFSEKNKNQKKISGRPLFISPDIRQDFQLLNN